jgi:hypothetical protein
MTALYDRIGVSYTRHRQPDPRIYAAFHYALGGAASVVNVGGRAGHRLPAACRPY